MTLCPLHVDFCTVWYVLLAMIGLVVIIGMGGLFSIRRLTREGEARRRVYQRRLYQDFPEIEAEHHAVEVEVAAELRQMRWWRM